MISGIIRAFQMILFARALVSWFPEVQRSQIGEILYRLTEPVLAPVRDFLRRVINLSIPIDLSFLVVYFGLEIINILLRGI